MSNYYIHLVFVMKVCKHILYLLGKQLSPPTIVKYLPIIRRTKVDNKNTIYNFSNDSPDPSPYTCYKEFISLASKQLGDSYHTGRILHSVRI